MYGSCDGFVNENAHFNPSTPYAVSRAAGDMSLNTFFENYNFPVVTTRAANVFGAGQQLYRIIPRTILFIKLGKRLQLHGGGLSERSFIHIDDVSRATFKLAEGGKAGETYHISTDRIISIRNLVELICSMMNVEFNDVVEIIGERPGKDSAYLLSSKKINNDVGWTHQISLEQGIQEVINWVDINFDVLKKQAFDYVHKK